MDTGGPEWVNLPPSCEILEPAEPSGMLTVNDAIRIVFRWRCLDPESEIGTVGGVVAVRIQLDGGAPVVLEQASCEGEWWFSSIAESGTGHRISSVNYPTGGNQPHEFRVWAQDVEGCWEPESEGARYTFSYNFPPSSEILTPGAGEEVNPSFTVSWEGSDPDGEVVEYQYALDPATSDWSYSELTSVTYEGIRSGEHEFRLRARDNAGCWELAYNCVSFSVE
jgi:hypothetical protein